MEDLNNLPDLKIDAGSDISANLPDLKIDDAGNAQTNLPDLNVTPDLHSDKPTDQMVGKAITDPNSFANDIGRAVDNAGASLGGFVQAIGEATKSDTLANWGSKFAQEQHANALQYGTPKIESFSKIKSIDDLKDWSKNVAANALVYATAPIAAAGGAVAAGAELPMVTVATLISQLPFTVGETENLIKELNPNAENPLAAIAGGTVEAGLNSFGLGKIFAPVAERLGADYLTKQLVDQGVEKSLAASWVQNTVTMGAIGAANSAIEQVAANGAAGTEIDSGQFIDGLLDAGISNALVGGVLGGATHASKYLSEKAMEPGSGNLEAVRKAQEKLDNANPAPIIDQYGTDKALYLTQGKALDPVEPLKTNSPSFSGLFDLVRKDRETPLKVTDTPNFHDRSKLIDATLMDLFHQARDNSKLSEKDFYSQYTASPKLEPEHLQLFDLINNTIRDKTHQEGIGGGVINRFLPQTWDKSRILANKEQFIKDVSPYASTEEIHSFFLHLDDPQEASTVAPINRLFEGGDTTADIASRYLDQNGEVRRKMISQSVPRKVGHLEYARRLPDVPQAVASKWNEGGFKGMDHKYADYIHQVSKRIAYAEAFGADGHKANTLIVKGIAENAQKGRPVLKSEIDHIYNVLDALNGQYGKVSGVAEKGLITAVKAGAITTSLTLSQLSSLVDPMNLMVKAGALNTLKGLMPAIHQTAHQMIRAIFNDVPRTELATTMAAAGLTMESARHTMLARAGDYSMGRLANSYVQGYFALNPVTYWTHFTRVWGAEVGKSIIQDDLQMSKYAPVTSQKGLAARLRLASNEINPDSYWNANPDTRNAMMARGVRSFVSETALEPGIADKPLWMSKSGWTQLLGIAKSYPIMFSNTVLPSLLKQLTPTQWGALEQMKGGGAVRAATSGLFVLGSFALIGALQDNLRNIVKQGTFDYEDKRTDNQKLLEIFDRTIEPMWASYLTEAYSAKQYGSDPVLALGGAGVSFVNKEAVDMTAIVNSLTNDLTGVDLSANNSTKSSIDSLTKWLIDSTPLSSFKSQIIPQ